MFVFGVWWLTGFGSWGRTPDFLVKRSWNFLLYKIVIRSNDTFNFGQVGRLKTTWQGSQGFGPQSHNPSSFWSCTRNYESRTVGACIYKWPQYDQVRHRVSSGVVVQVWDQCLLATDQKMYCNWAKRIPDGFWLRGSNPGLPGPKHVIMLVLYQKLWLSCTVAACISKWPKKTLSPCQTKLMHGWSIHSLVSSPGVSTTWSARTRKCNWAGCGAGSRQDVWFLCLDQNYIGIFARFNLFSLSTQCTCASGVTCHIQ